MQHHEESPFHAVGFALMAYVEAMLGFETDKIQTALDRIAAAEALARQFVKKAKKKNWHSMHSKNSSSTTTTTGTVVEEEIESISFNQGGYSGGKKLKSPEIQYELLATNCMLMSSTIQFLRNSWLEYMKAAYKLRKAYKLYEQMFESLTGQKASEYASALKSNHNKMFPSTPPSSTTTTSSTTSSSSRRSEAAAATDTTPFEQQHLTNNNNNLSISALFTNSSHVKASWNEKRISLFHIPSPTAIENLKKRPMSTHEFPIDHIPSSYDAYLVINNAIESGIFFGIGLFSLVFSLLPPRGKKVNYKKH